MSTFLALLAVLFIALKIAGIIAWPWIVVLIPVMFLLVIPVAIFLFIAFVALFA